MDNIKAVPGRFLTGIKEFDDVLGGGFTPGMTVILGGPRGVGKTSLMLQVADSFQKLNDGEVVFMSGEQSSKDVDMITKRLGISNANLKKFGNEGDIYKITEIVNDIITLKAKLLIIDSLQAVCLNDVSGDYGSQTQLKSVVFYLHTFAKTSDCIVVMITHLIKDFNFALPSTSEHTVDCNLMLDFSAQYGEDGKLIGGRESVIRERELRTLKNRFGVFDVRTCLEFSPEGFKSL